MATAKLKPPAGRRIIELPNAPQGAPTSGTLVRINPPAKRQVATGGMDFEVPGAPKEEAGGSSFTRGALSMLGDIIPGSVGENIGGIPRAVGSIIKGLPIFFGKGLQTAAGATELLSPAGQARVATGQSRLQEDWRKGQELGLEGDALVFYSLQRQLPLAGDYGTSVVQTGRNIAELATAGRYDYGDNGINYARAWEQGNLGGLLIEDLGNIVLLGRGAGLGNVIARGGQAVSRAGAPRLGQAITTTGRFAEEPIGTMGRGTARLVAPAAQRAGMPRTAAAAGRIAAAIPDTTAGVGPFRQTVTEITGASRGRAAGRWDQLQVEINDLADERNSLIAFDPNNPRIAEINTKIGQLEKRQDSALIRAGFPKDVRTQIRQGQQNYEAYRTAFQETSAQFAKAGIEPRSRQLLEAEAGRKRAEAARLREQGETARADELDRQADQAILFAELNDQYPGVLNGPVRAEVSPAAHIILDEQVPFIRQMIDEGMNAQQIANLLTSPRVAPDIQYRGYRYSAADVQYLIDYLNGTLNPAEMVALVAVYNHYKNWSDWFTAQQLAGRGRKEPLSYVALQRTPDPKKLLEFIDRYGKAGQELMRVLDETLALIAEQTSPGILDEFGFNPESPTGVFKAFADTDYGSIPFNLANAAIIVRYAELATNPQFTQIFRSPDIYPPNMRRLMEAEERFMAGTRAEAVQSMLDDLKLIAEQFADFLDQRTLDAIAARIAKLENTPAAFDRVQFNRLADSVARMAARALKRLEAAAQATDILTEQQQAILADIEFGYSTLNSLEAYLRNLAEGDPAMSPRLRTAEANQQALADEKAALVSEKTQLDEQFAAQRAEQEPRLKQAQEQVAGIEGQRATISDEISTLATQRETLQAELNRAQQDLIDFETYGVGDGAVAVVDDYQKLLDARDQGIGPERITDADARAAKKAAVDEANQEVARAMGDLDDMGVNSRFPFRRNTTVDESGTERIGVTKEDIMVGLERQLPDTPEQPWLTEFLETYTAEDGAPIDSRIPEGMDLDEAAYIEQAARLFRSAKEAEEVAKDAQKRSLKKYKDDLRAQTENPLDEFLRSDSATGLPAESVERLFRMLQEGPDATRTRVSELNDQLATIERKIADATTKSQDLGEQARLARRETELVYETPTLRRASEIERRLRQIRRQEAPRRRAVEFARKAEPAEALRAERARLRGVGRVLRPEAGAEGPRGAQILRGVRTAAEKRLARLEGEEAAKTAVISRLKTEQQRLSALESQARGARDAAVNAVETQQRQPFGPLRTGLSGRTTYMPGGMTQNVRNARNIATEMRSDGAAPQLKTQAELSRFTAIQPLSLEETAIKIGELTNAFNRHVIVEEILTDPNMTKNPVSLLGVERIDAIRTKAEQRVMEQTRTQTQEGLTRSQQDIDAAVRQEFGRLLTEEINRAGYEPVSRVDVDPETGQHEAVGNLLDKVAPEDVNESTFLMRRGMAERIVQEFVSKAATNIPDRVANLAQSIGNLTGGWKTMVLPFSLRWQIGDLAGNVMNAWMIGDVPPNILIARMMEVNQRLGIDRKNVLDAADIAYDGLVKVLQDAGLQARSVKLSSIAALRSPEANPATAINDLNMMFGPLQQLRRNAFKFNEFQNLVARTAFAIEKLNQILTQQGRSIEEVTPQSLYNDPVLTKAIQDAVAETHKALGAFSEMSPWERRVIRQVYPFWAWVRFINKAAVNLVIDNPDRVLFTLALGSMVSEPDDTGYFSFLQGTIPISGIYTNLEFLVPYQDAIIFGENPVARLQETVTGLSPVIRTPMRAAGLLTQYATGWQTWPFDTVSQPSYLEGRPGQSQRDVGILAGELAYLFLKDWGGPLRTSLEWLPSNIPGLTEQGRIIGTDVAVGPGPRFAQGSLRTTGRYAEPRLSGTQQRLSAIMRALGVPGAPIADVEAIRQQSQQGRLLDQRARLRKQQEMLRSRLG
jgi:hypothetical protein